MVADNTQQDPVVITGIGMVTSLGIDRESTWDAIVGGQCGIRKFDARYGVPDGVRIAAQVQLPNELRRFDQLNSIRFSQIAFDEALRDAQVSLDSIAPHRIGLGCAAHMGDVRIRYFEEGVWSAADQVTPWWSQWLPNSVAHSIIEQRPDFKYPQIQGPRLCYSTACASSMIAMIQSIRAIRRGEADIMVAGGGECIDNLFASGFFSMRALSRSENPEQGCQPFDVNRSGFVMGEGACYIVFERLSHAVARGATIYASVLTERMASQAHHITSLEVDNESLSYLIRETIRSCGLLPADIDYINAHGTGTEQNDLTEITCINQVFNSDAERLHVSSTKSQIGHLVNASGSTELAITTLGLRDGVSPPTVNLNEPESDCLFNCVANQSQQRKAKTSIKISQAFGGHLASIALQRFEGHDNSFAYPKKIRAA